MISKLSKKQIDEKSIFIDNFINANNAANGSEVDSNSNVTQKTLATLEAELYKDYTIQLNRNLIYNKLKTIYDSNIADKYMDDLSNHLIYTHDESSTKPYCASISMYPFLLEGTKCIGGVSKAPKNLQSFNGSFVNFVYQVASDFAGAIATVEYLHIFDWFARNQYGDNYLETNSENIAQEFQGTVYALNQPASARGNQSVFWNISVFDMGYMQAMFDEFFYPDGTKINYESTMKLQKFFMDWFRKEREKELLTFPVLTASILESSDKNSFIDDDFVNFCCSEMELGLSFFIYQSDKADSLSSCCRLRNELADNDFSYTLGAGGVVTGSSQVITINANRLFQKYGGFVELPNLVDRLHKYLTAFRLLYKDYINAGLIPTYSAGIMDLDKQFVTIGINGLVEAAEFVGLNISNNKSYKEFLQKFLQTIKDKNTEYRLKTGIKVNTEIVPAENLGVKNAKWDKQDGLIVKRDCYNSYFYSVEDSSITILDKIALHGDSITAYLDGGSALHENFEHLLTQEQFHKLFLLAMRQGVPYWTFNVKMTCCSDCGYIDTETRKTCKKCHSDNVYYATRVIGYLKPVKNFSDKRQQEEGNRFYDGFDYEY